jgi:hypothetical protein
MQLVSIGRALGAVGPLLALLLAVLTPSATDGAASVTDENADVHYGLVNAQLNVGTMNSPSKRAAQGLAGNNWGIAIDGDSIPIDTKIKVVKHHETCAADEETTFNIGNNEAMTTGTVDGATTAYFQGMMASQAGAYKNLRHGRELDRPAQASWRRESAWERRNSRRDQLSKERHPHYEIHFGR